MAALPAPKPLSPRAAQFVRDLFREEQQRQAAITKAFNAGVASVTAPTAPVRKGKAKPQVAVYDADGNLIGTVDPDVVTELAQATAPGAKPGDKQEASLGGPKPAPAASVPVEQAQTSTDAELTKAVAHFGEVGRFLKAKLEPGSNANAAEQIRAHQQLDTLSLATFQAIRARRGTRML